MSRMSNKVIFFCVTMLLIKPTYMAYAEFVDDIVAAVNNDVITASELNQAVALNERLGRSSGGDRKKLESETLEGLINRRLLVQEARRLTIVEVSDSDINDEMVSLKKQFGSDAAFSDFLKSADMTQQELAHMLGEQILVQKFIEKKVGTFVRVTREDAQSYFDSHPEEFKGERFQDVQKSIVMRLTDDKIDQHLSQYLKEIRGKADIRINRDTHEVGPINSKS